jgi:hypothetical protein
MTIATVTTETEVAITIINLSSLLYYTNILSLITVLLGGGRGFNEEICMKL